MESFSRKTKNSILEMQFKKKCCKRMLDAGVGFSESDDSAAASVESNIAYAKCPNCVPAYVAGLFVSCGSVTDPTKNYHLDLSFVCEQNAEKVCELLQENGLNAKLGKRRNKTVVYLKESGAIEDFLAYIGANNAVFEFMNSKIVRELRNNANRVVNCDTANIRKTLAASQRYLDVIAELMDTGAIDQLDPDLKETALLRVKYDQLTIAELGEKHKKTISKSGVKHRLEKIVDFYESWKNKK